MVIRSCLIDALVVFGRSLALMFWKMWGSFLNHPNECLFEHKSMFIVHNDDGPDPHLLGPMGTLKPVEETQ